MAIYMWRDYSWQPGVNTIAYYPLTSSTTVNNQISGGTNLTNSNCTFGMAYGVDCVSISGNTDTAHSVSKYLYGNISGLPTGASPRTFCFWAYNSNTIGATVTNECYIFQGQGSTNKMVFVANGVDSNGEYFISQWGDVNSSSVPVLRNQWCHHVVVYDGNKFVWYINGKEIINWTYAINTGSNKFSLGGASENNCWNTFNGSFSRVIIEDKAWTSDDAKLDFISTKALYGYPSLPSEYKEIKYIESDGYAYIDTGVTASSVSKINISLSDISMGSGYLDQYAYIVFGTSANSRWMSSIYYVSSGARFRYHLGDGSKKYYDCNATQTGVKNQLEYSSSNFVVNGTSGSYIGTDSSWVDASSYNIHLWHCGNGSFSKYKLYSCKITNTSSNLVRDFVPCYRKSDNEIGLYDTVNDIFYVNSGTGTFTKGDDVS